MTVVFEEKVEGKPSVDKNSLKMIESKITEKKVHERLFSKEHNEMFKKKHKPKPEEVPKEKKKPDAEYFTELYKKFREKTAIVKKLKKEIEIEEKHVRRYYSNFKNLVRFYYQFSKVFEKVCTDLKIQANFTLSQLNDLLKKLGCIVYDERVYVEVKIDQTGKKKTEEKENVLVKYENKLVSDMWNGICDLSATTVSKQRVYQFLLCIFGFYEVHLYRKYKEENALPAFEVKEKLKFDEKKMKEIEFKLEYIEKSLASQEKERNKYWSIGDSGFMISFNSANKIKKDFHLFYINWSNFKVIKVKAEPLNNGNFEKFKINKKSEKMYQKFRTKYMDNEKKETVDYLISTKKKREK